MPSTFLCIYNIVVIYTKLRTFFPCFTDDKTQKKPLEEPQEKPARKRKWGSARSTSTPSATTQAKTQRLSSIEFSTESLKVCRAFWICFSLLSIFWVIWIKYFHFVADTVEIGSLEHWYLKKHGYVGNNLEVPWLDFFCPQFVKSFSLISPT